MGYLYLYLLVSLSTITEGWLGSRVVSVLDSGAEGPGFKSQPRRFWDTSVIINQLCYSRLLLCSAIHTVVVHAAVWRLDVLVGGRCILAGRRCAGAVDRQRLGRWCRRRAALPSSRLRRRLLRLLLLLLLGTLHLPKLRPSVLEPDLERETVEREQSDTIQSICVLYYIVAEKRH